MTSKIIPLFKTRDSIIDEVTNRLKEDADKLILVYVTEEGQLECLASEDVTIIEGVGMLETAKAGFIISSYDNTD